jgi:hypothetical protein
MPDEVLAWLQQWYQAQCDGEWEHQKGVRIDTLDNPGWAVKADVMMSSPPDPLAIDRSEHDWIRCEVKGARFEGFGGPGNLIELLNVLRSWVQASRV